MIVVSGQSTRHVCNHIFFKKSGPSKQLWAMQITGHQNWMVDHECPHYQFDICIGCNHWVRGRSQVTVRRGASPDILSYNADGRACIKKH